jgi:hypothetical protein
MHLAAGESMFPKIVCLAIAIICSSLLSACKELAIPSFAEIPIPERIIEPKSTITLTAANITDTVPSNSRQLAIVWSTGAGYYVGVLDTDANLIRQFKVSLSSAFFSEGLLWSPDGNTLIYQQTSLDHGFDILALHPDAPDYIHTIDNFHYPPSCTWSPDGRYLACSKVMCHGCNEDLDVYESTNWESVCYTYLDFVYRDDLCRSLKLNNGEPWNTQYSELLREKMRVSQKAQEIAKEFCRRYKDDAQGCWRETGSNDRFVFVGAEGKWVIVDVDKRQAVRIETRPDDLSWSVDKSHLAWTENGELRVFDTATYAVTLVTLPDAKFLNVSWHP